MVDTATSKAAAARREGSTPSWGTMVQHILNRVLETVRTVLVGCMKECDVRIQKTELDKTN